MSIRLADLRLIDARLPEAGNLTAQTIVSKYRLGDRVEITCREIRPVWEAETSRYQSLELAKSRFLEHGSSEEIARILASRYFWRGVNLLPHPAAPDSEAAAGTVIQPDSPKDADLVRLREIVLRYAAGMPNFVADETVTRETAIAGSDQWTHLDTIESEITFTGDRAVRQQIRRDGLSWDEPYAALPGFKPYGGFGTELQPLFDPHCRTTIAYEGSEDVRGHQLGVYRFSAPVDSCFGPFTSGFQRYNPARNGRVYVDGVSGDVFQLEDDASEFPAGFDVTYRKEEEYWDYVKIGDESHLVPIAADYNISFTGGRRLRITVEYKNQRHFEASSTIDIH